MSYIAGGVKLQMEFTFNLLNDELTASGKDQEIIILESRFFSPRNKLGEGCLLFRKMVANVGRRYKELTLKEDLKGKIIKCLIDIDFYRKKTSTKLREIYKCITRKWNTEI